MKNKKILIVVAVFIILLIIGLVIFFSQGKKKEQQEENIQISEAEKVKEEEKKEEAVQGTVDIINVNSKTRPYAIVVNNTPVAVKVQEGLNRAYLVYEIPTEGNTSRLMALYKDIEDDLTVGTIRSARHNFIDYALESDAIFVHYGWSHYSMGDEKIKKMIDYINGLFDSPFWRSNPEKLATEHTAYTSTDRIKQNATSKGYKLESDDTMLLNYYVEDVDLSKKEKVKSANRIIIPYGANPNITTFVYDSENKMYNRQEAGNNCIDHKTGEQVSTKNIIIQKIDHEMADDNYYWKLKTTGTGEGFFITNGYAVPIKWEKKTRTGKTKYYYEDGKELQVSDGRTYIELQSTKQTLTIE